MRVASLALLVVCLVAMLAVNEARSVRSSPSDKVKVEFFVMSKCPDAATCESVFAPSLYALAPILDLSVSTICTYCSLSMRAMSVPNVLGHTHYLTILSALLSTIRPYYWC